MYKFKLKYSEDKLNRYLRNNRFIMRRHESKGHALPTWTVAIVGASYELTRCFIFSGAESWTLRLPDSGAVIRFDIADNGCIIMWRGFFDRNRRNVQAPQRLRQYKNDVALCAAIIKSKLSERKITA